MSEQPAPADPDVEIGRKLRAGLGHPVSPGACHDCGGLGVVPAMTSSQVYRTWCGGRCR